MSERKYPTNAAELIASGEIGRWQQESYKITEEPQWLKVYPKVIYPKLRTRQDGFVFTANGDYFAQMLGDYPQES